MQLLPHAGPLPVAQAARTAHARPAARFPGQVFPRDASAQHGRMPRLGRRGRQCAVARPWATGSTVEEPVQ
jgi:hypothetical protein